ncbi:uncharacterized protein ATC70_003810 [Mucor velutinosus]|uniref:Oxidation resistance protein 1 n=1 Tax=Mucor velutinosus TaxID=708070 RepID=A0AAN7DBW7_9FUNG|nr:hypothetical protein ATC70_003810 [Mucor velutinosus]
MKRLTSISATPNRHHHHHHHHQHSHSHSFSYTNNNTNKERLFPLHRSITEDDKYQHTHVSPITKFVCKLLGLAGPSSSSSTTSASTTTRPKSWHKSRSTTSITKSSVTSSYQHTTLHACSSAEIAASATASPSAATTTTPRKPTAITIVTPKPCTLTASIMEWDHQQEEQPKVEDDVISVSSSESSSTSTSGTMHSSISSISNTKTTSAAVDALVIASLLPSTTKAATVTKTRSTDELDDMPSIHLIGRQFDIKTAVLTETIAEMVRPYIPRRYRIAQKWNLLYSLDQHGVSLATLYSCMKSFEGPCIMVIKDAQNQIFGSYLSHPFSSQSHYYGTGECFLWKLNQQEPQPKIKVFPWTGKNDYMMLSDSNFIAIGGGDGKFGLWLNSELEKGHSSTCPTFDNEVLALQPEFQCMEMEVWGLCI